MSAALAVVVDVDDGTPPWRQIRDQILRAILTGALAPGARLPPIRQLARDLGLAPGTIARTYHDLESQNWVHTGRAKGTVVTEAAASAVTEELRSAARAFAQQAGTLGVDPDLAVQAVLAAFAGS